jgi:hypothetical protein
MWTNTTSFLPETFLFSAWPDLSDKFTNPLQLTVGHVMEIVFNTSYFNSVRPGQTFQSKQVENLCCAELCDHSSLFTKIHDSTDYTIVYVTLDKLVFGKSRFIGLRI